MMFERAFVQQLRRITFSYGPKHPASAGQREFLNNELVALANKYSNVVFDIQANGQRNIPFVKGSYLNGQKHRIDLTNKSATEVRHAVQLLLDRSGNKMRNITQRTKQQQHTVQGVWSPFRNKNAALYNR